eukprot:scaffold4101_cov267-Pinguiococcus_pyrenoidosus.AAC.4
MSTSYKARTSFKDEAASSQARDINDSLLAFSKPWQILFTCASCADCRSNNLLDAVLVQDLVHLACADCRSNSNTRELLSYLEINALTDFHGFAQKNIFDPGHDRRCFIFSISALLCPFGLTRKSATSYLYGKPPDRRSVLALRLGSRVAFSAFHALQRPRSSLAFAAEAAFFVSRPRHSRYFGLFWGVEELDI